MLGLETRSRSRDRRDHIFMVSVSVSVSWVQVSVSVSWVEVSVSPDSGLGLETEIEISSKQCTSKKCRPTRQRPTASKQQQGCCQLMKVIISSSSLVFSPRAGCWHLSVISPFFQPVLLTRCCMGLRRDTRGVYRSWYSP